MEKSKLKDLCIDGKGSYGIAASAVPFDESLYTYLRITDINDDGTLNKSDLKSVDETNASDYLLQPNDIVFARTGGSTGRNYFYDGHDGQFVYAGFLIKFSIDPKKINPKFVKYYCLSQKYRDWVQSFNTGSTRGNINAQTFGNMEISFPSREQQDLLVRILSSLDDKIELNNKINDNLEQQAQAVFRNLFAAKIENVSETDGKPLGELIDIVDNRGKTPPSSSEKNDFPILDVGALNSNGRIINYKNCTKFVDENTYNTFFRDGHPVENDILISTVGSLGQMKLFKGNKGCIAQNVVAFRTLVTSATYMYEYLKYIKNDLLAYDIGSVQPSIKVTHIIKHLIYIPMVEELTKFDSVAQSITEQIYNNVCENERLISIRDTLLPKLMSGELDVDKIEL